MHEPLIPGGWHLACWQVSWLAAQLDIRLGTCLPVRAAGAGWNSGVVRHSRSIGAAYSCGYSSGMAPERRAPDSLLIHPTMSGIGTKQAYAKELASTYGMPLAIPNVLWLAAGWRSAVATRRYATQTVLMFTNSRMP